MPLLWVLSLADGEHDLIAIAKSSRLSRSNCWTVRRQLSSEQGCETIDSLEAPEVARMDVKRPRS